MTLVIMNQQETGSSAVEAGAVSVPRASRTPWGDVEPTGPTHGDARSITLRRLLWLSMAGPVVMIVAILAAAALDPAYSHRQPVSLLAAKGAPTAPLVTFGFLAAGVGLMLLMAVLSRLKAPVGRSARAVGFASGALIATSSFFPCSPGCPAPWTAEAANQDMIHFGLVLAAVIGFATAPAITWSRLSGLSAWASYRRATGLLALAIITGGFLTFTSEALRVPILQDTTGIWQRVSVGASVAWFVLTGVVSLKGHGRGTTQHHPSSG